MQFSCVGLFKKSLFCLTDLGPITCQCNRLQVQLLSKTMITDYNYIFLNVIDYNYNYFAK